VSSCVSQFSGFPASRNSPGVCFRAERPELGDGVAPGNAHTVSGGFTATWLMAMRRKLAGSSEAHPPHPVDVGLGHQQVDVVGL